jgi:predicted AlkP superfamily phosphohydrolase/phosphomutase
VKKRVVVLGLDGLEPTIVDSLLARNELPNFFKLRAQGSYSRLRTTYPAQTPVAWSSFATGTNPGGHGIFDFIRRDPRTYLPDLALSHYEPPRNTWSPPRVVSNRKGVALWHLLARAGVPSTVLRCPCTFPPESDGGRILAGVGVPDLRGGQGTGTFYTQDRGAVAQENEQVITLDPGDDVKTRLVGPRDTRSRPVRDMVSDLRVRANRAGRSLLFETGGAPARVEIAERSWGPWVRVKFKLSLLQSASGLVRLFVRQVAPHLEFYASPVNFDPAAPLFPVSSPANYAAELAEHIGLFSTLGMAEDHTGHNNGRFDESDFLAQCGLVFEEREKMMAWELARLREGLLFTLFDTPDRLQHMFWRFRDPLHPAYDPDRAREFTGHLEELYRRCDRVLGKALDSADENTLLLVLSDHGFNSFRRAFDTNTWLWQHGLLKLQDGKQPADLAEEGGNAAVDWSRTYAYGVGLGGIYLNRRGREAQGILDDGAEAERVCSAIERGLGALVDESAAAPAVHSVSRAAALYTGAFAQDAPDLLVNFRPGFRVSWQTALGGFAASLFADNTRRWSGDHIIDPDAVPGILLMNRRLRRDQPHIVDLAPTILAHMGVPPHEAMEGASLV